MKALLISRTVIEDHSVMLNEHDYDNFLKLWHYHPEVELAVIRESTGTRFVGDSIQKFEEGEIVMIGKNLPHLWLNDDIYFGEQSGLRARAHVIHFHKNFPKILSSMPEMEKISQLFKRAERGIKFEGASNKQIISMVKEMFHLRGLNRFMKVLGVLKLLAGQQDYRLLSGPGFLRSVIQKDDGRMTKAFEYIMNHFTDNLRLSDVAGHINMNPSSFSRYFKRVNKKTFTRILNEVRIGFACKLLLDERYNISA